MPFEEDDRVVLHDQHSEFDGEVGTVTRVMDTMFGDSTYTVSFDGGQEQGVPEDSLEPAESDGNGNEDENAADVAGTDVDAE